MTVAPLASDVVKVVLVGTASADGRLCAALEAEGDIAVVGRCDLGVGSAARIAALAPDVVVAATDPGVVQMVQAVMASAPRPILVLRTGEEPGAAEMEAGAVDVFALPTGQVGPDLAAHLRRRVRLVRKVVVIRHRSTREPAHTPPIVGIAASTGGPRALATVVRGLVCFDAPILIVQHMHRDFVEGLVRWLAQTTGAEVVLAEEGIRPQPGLVYVGPADRHLRLGTDRLLRLPEQPLSVHRPSADEMFSSLATSLGSAAIGVLLTGMGEDGAAGLLAIRSSGGTTIAQDEATSAIFGMPRAAQAMGAASIVASLAEIPRAVRRAVSRCA